MAICTLLLTSCSRPESTEPKSTAAVTEKTPPEDTATTKAAADHGKPATSASAPIPGPANRPLTDDPASLPSAIELASIASVALADGRSQVAFETIRRAYRMAPDEPQVCFLMARLLGTRNRFAEAIQILDKLATRHPELRLPVLGQTADWMVQSGLWSEAEQRYAAILEQIPDAAMAHRKLAELATRRGNKAAAAEHLFSLCRLGAAEQDELQSLLFRMCRLSDETFDPVETLGNARAEVDCDDWDAAQKRLESSGTDDPKASALLGRIYAVTRNFAALETWNTSEQSETLGDAWFAKAVLAADRGNQLEAIRCLTETVARDQTDHQAYSLLSQALQQSGQKETAETAADRAELIRQTQQLGQELSLSADFDSEKSERLAELLDQLHRPLEAIEWRRLQLAHLSVTGGVSASEAELKISGLEQQRARLILHNDGRPTRDFLICDVDIGTLDNPQNADPDRETEPSK